MCAAPDLGPYDNLLMLLNREDISCSTVQIGSGPHPHCAYGYSTDLEVLRHLSSSTSGRYFEMATLTTANIQHTLTKAFSPSTSPNGLVYGIPADGEYLGQGEAGVLVSDMGALHAMMAVDYPYPWVGPPPPVPLLQTQVKDYPLDCDLVRLVDVRVREGFYITNTDSMERKSNLVVKLLLAWLPNVKIEYTIQALKANTTDGEVLRVTLSVLAYYEFLHQFTSVQKQKLVGGIAPSIAKLQNFLNHIQETDRLLTYLYAQCHVGVANPQGARTFWKLIGSLVKIMFVL